MLYKIVAAAIVAAQANAFTGMVDYSALFRSWKAEHNKVYESAAAESKAFSAFATHEVTITKHNAEGRTYTLGHNEFSDLTSEEFFRYYTGYNNGAAKAKAGSVHAIPAGEKLADAVDWVTAGAVTNVKNQGMCGSCWSFSTTGSLEGAYQIATKELVSFSEEQLVECDHTDNGCSGGLMDNAFEFIKTNGLAAEAAYPYISGTGITGLCKPKANITSVVTLDGFVDVPVGDEDALKSAVAKGPVSIAIEADKKSFQLYKTGVFDNKGCGTKLDHGVLVVGYGTENGKDYWKVKNSWGATWGDAGYIKFVFGKNQCGIANSASYPTGAKKM